MSKSVKLPFYASNNESDEHLFKIYCDLWGPAPTKFVQGFKYYALFVDDFTRFSWLYPLKRQSEFLRCFVLFHKLMEKQLDKSIKVFQSDGGGGFSSKDFLNYLSNHDIIHQLSCPGTPEQNGVAARKHHHVIELGLAMMYHACIPRRYWVEAFGTTIYLINKLPTPCLEMISLLQKLTNKKPEYSSLRVFGSRRFPYLRNHTIRKFDPRSLPCVFLC